MKKFEYLQLYAFFTEDTGIVFFSDDKGKRNLFSLEGLGEEGWELVYIVRNYYQDLSLAVSRIAIFKREK